MLDDKAVYDAADPEAIASAERQKQVRETDDNETVRIWMNHPKGRDLLYRFVFEVAKTEQEFVAVDLEGRTDKYKTFVSIGERNMGKWWHDAIRRHPDLYAKMLQEQEFERVVRASRLRNQAEQQEASDGYGTDDAG